MSWKSCTGTTIITTKRVAYWEDLMKKYTKKHELKCNYEDIPPPSPYFKKFATGSSYIGAFDVINMSGYGEFTFPNGVMYRGEFQDGLFHGPGELIYKDGPEAGSIIRGTWEKGILTERQIIFHGTLQYEDEWKYCQMPDRRYLIEYETDLQPPPNSYVAPEVPRREIPPGYHDTGDGFYDPETRFVYSYNFSEVLRGPSIQEQKWIVDNCCKERLGPIGPRPEYYETWPSPIIEPTPLPDPIVAFSFQEQSEAQENSEDLVEVFYDSSKLESIAKF